MAEKMTNVKAIEFVMANFELPTEVAEKFEKMKISFERKNSRSGKPTKTQQQNEVLKEDILRFMKPEQLYSIEDLRKGVPSLVEIEASNQKVSALLKQLKELGLVKRVEDKRKVFFQL